MIYYEEYIVSTVSIQRPFEGVAVFINLVDTT